MVGKPVFSWSVGQEDKSVDPGLDMGVPVGRSTTCFDVGTPEGRLLTRLGADNLAGPSATRFCVGSSVGVLTAEGPAGGNASSNVLVLGVDMTELLASK